MNLRYESIFSLLLVVSFFLAAPAYAQDMYKLKPGAKGKLCLECHEAFREKLKSAFVHAPLKKGDCTTCHNPHASSHGQLLVEGINNICYKCHTKVIPEKSRSVHPVVAEGHCVNCHDPHASNNRFQLIKAGNDLCLECHKDLGNTVTKVKFKHPPVETGCLNCHSPHASANSDFLLKDNEPSLCMTCHKTGKPGFAKLHMDYPVAKAPCTGCHNPHGSDQAGLLYDHVHPPVAGKMCNACHEEPASPRALKTVKLGSELCRECHGDMVNETFSKNRVHWPLAGKEGCLSCHSPHASTEKYLLKEPVVKLCGNCHSDTIARAERSSTKHAPVKEGNCTACHSPHASDNPFLIKQPSMTMLCETCHTYEKPSMHHPIGEKVVDPRNKNLTVDCLSCHRAHGSEYKKLLHFETTKEMCIQCHTQYKG